MMSDLIDRAELLTYLNACISESDGQTPIAYAVLTAIKCAVEQMPTIDAVPVVRCKDCIWYHHAHAEKDGVEYEYSEMPDEAFDGLCAGYVTSDYGINVSGKCEIDKYAGYECDKSVFRREDDFCSRGERRIDE